MDDLMEIKARLDNELKDADETVGIMFGTLLFEKFRERDWFTLEQFGALGTSLFSEKVVAYNRTHYSFISWDIDELEFRVGKSIVD